MRVLLGRAWAFGVVLGAAVGCAPTQVVPIDLEPASAEVYVDGARVETRESGALELRADRSHILMFKSAGYRSQQMMLETGRVEGRHRLQPDRVEVRLAPTASSGRSLRMELDE